MSDKPSDLVQGTLDMLILKTLALEPMHGYGISVRIEQMSKGVFRLNAGSLFLAIQRASCPKISALGLIKRRAALQAENIVLPHQLSVLQRTNFAVQWGANR